MNTGRIKILFILLLICCFGFGMRIYKLDSRSIWADETFTLFESTGQGTDLDSLLNAEHAATGIKASKPLTAGRYKSFLSYNSRRTLKDTVESILKTDTHPPFYFLIMHIWIKYFGSSLFSIRFFSVLCGVLSVIFVFLFMSLLFDKKTAIFSALFIAFSPFAVFYSQEGRNYSLVLVLLFLSSYFMLRYQKSKENSFPYGFIISSAAGLYTHYFYILILLAQVAYFIFFSDSVKEKKDKFCLAFLAILFLYLPWIFTLLKYGYNFGLIALLALVTENNLITILQVIASKLAFFFTAQDSKVSICLVLNYVFLVVCLLLFGNALLQFNKNLIFPVLIILLGLLPFALVDILEGGIVLFQERYYVFAFAGFIPIVGYILASSWKSVLYKSLVISFFLVLIMNSFLLINGLACQEISSPRPENASLWINQKRLGKKAVVAIFNRRVCVMPVVYYLDKDIIIAPFNDSEELKKVFAEFSGKTEYIFFVQSFFKFQKNYDLEQAFLKAVSSSNGYNLKEEKQFSDDYVKVTEFICSGRAS